MRIPFVITRETLSLFVLPSSPETNEHVLRIRARNSLVEQSPRRVSPPRQALFSVQRLPHDLRDIRSREHVDEDIEQKDASHHVLERINVRRYQRLAKRKRVSIVRGK